jgi:hypothetical protein
MPKVSQRSREYVRDRIQDHMEAYVTIYRHGDADFSATTGLVTYPSRSPYYAGKARVWQLNDGDAVVSGEADITILTTNISIPWTAPSPLKDDILVINRNVVDATTVGRVFRVMYVDGGGYIGGTRRMRCVSFSDSAVWENQ